MTVRYLCRTLLALGLGALAFSAVAGTWAAGSAGAAALQDWIISSRAISLINGYTGSSTLTASAFDVPSTAQIGAPAAGWVTQRTAVYTFYGPVSKPSSFLYALKHGSVPAGTVYVLLDMESWALTPHPEQVTPKVYMKEFVTAAIKHGYQPVLAPSLSLTTGMTCHNASDPGWKNYLVDCAVPAMAAQAHPAVYEIQSQAYEGNTSGHANCACYQWFTGQAAAQARGVVTGLDVRAGLSTNPGGHVSTGQTLYTDTLNTEGSVNGYWLNVPEQGTACPSCVPGGAPQVAVAYLELLGYPK
jgi:hypothetical protein